MKSNVIPITRSPRAREAMRDQACAWLARLDQGASEEDLAKLYAWLAEDPRHIHMLLSMAAMWDQALVLSELAEVFPLENQYSRTRRRFLRASAAGFAAVAVLGGAWLSPRLRSGAHVARTLDQHFETAVGERRAIDLPDGSGIVLNTDTRMHVQYTARQRHVVLERGEGYFTVAQDVERPFKVFAGSHVVEAIGTAFTVQHTVRKELEVLVTEGRVNFVELAPASPALGAAPEGVAAEPTVERVMPVVAGERVTILQVASALPSATLEKVQLAPDELELKLAWRVGMLAFQGDPLQAVLDEVGRYTTVKLQAEESIRNVQVDGVFRAGDIDALLVAMERNFRIAARRVGEDEILLIPEAEAD